MIFQAAFGIFAQTILVSALMKFSSSRLGHRWAVRKSTAFKLVFYCDLIHFIYVCLFVLIAFSPMPGVKFWQLL